MEPGQSSSRSITIETSRVSVCQLPSYHREVHNLFEKMIHRTWGHAHWHPAVDVVETADAFVVEIDLPGVMPETVEVSFIDDRLIVEGDRKISREHLCPVCLHSTERPVGRYHASVQFPGELDTEKLTKSHDNGVLSIRIPKK